MKKNSRTPPRSSGSGSSKKSAIDHEVAQLVTMVWDSAKRMAGSLWLDQWTMSDFARVMAPKLEDCTVAEVQAAMDQLTTTWRGTVPRIPDFLDALRAERARSMTARPPVATIPRKRPVPTQSLLEEMNAPRRALGMRLLTMDELLATARAAADE